MLFNFFRLIFGCVYFTAYGGFAERFINLCTANGIPLWSIKKRPSGLTACTTVSGYKKIKASAKASGMTVRIKKKVGLPFVLHRYESHSGLFVGLVAVVLILTLMSNRIWVVNVHGNTTVSDEKIEQIFSDAGATLITVRATTYPSASVKTDIPFFTWLTPLTRSPPCIPVCPGFVAAEPLYGSIIST